jgi:ferredoxin
MTPLLRTSTDRKTAGSVTPSGTPNIKNAFGLLSGADYSCPGMTSVCAKVCYAGKLEGLYPAFRDVMQANWDAIRVMDYPTMLVQLGALIGQFVADCDRTDKRNVKAGRKLVDRVFRIHHDGDFFSLDYARAWADVCRAWPDVRFWAYTRSFTPSLNVVPALAGIPNLTLYLSVDEDNREHAAAALVSAQGATVRVATLADTAEQAKALTASTTGRAIVPCPEVMGKLPLVVGERGDTDRRGACVACGLCVQGRKDVAFSVSGK